MRALETNRLVLREWREEDSVFLPDVLADPEVMKYSDDGPLDEERMRDWLRERLRDDGSDEVLGNRAMERKKTNEVIGYVSLSDAGNRCEPGDVELGIRLLRSAWGHGFAYEAASIVTAFAFERQSTKRLVGIADPKNAKSVQLLLRLGMVFDREIEFAGYDHPDHLFSLNRSKP